LGLQEFDERLGIEEMRFRDSPELSENFIFKEPSREHWRNSIMQ
jgi:hypothetical protein